MIIINLRLDNCFNFSGVELNLSYPKKIAYSTIENEFLETRPNFRFKKAVVLMGSNATGKTCLGRAIKNTCDFLNTGNSAYITDMVNDKQKPATVVLEFVNNDCILKEAVITCDKGKVRIALSTANIAEKDSYESAHAKLKNIYAGIYPEDFVNLIGELDCRFAYPEIERSPVTEGIDKDIFLKTLKAVIGTLDPSLKEVKVSADLANGFIIRRGDSEIVIKDGRVLNKELLSSGTVEGVDIAVFLASMQGKQNCLYYCDEHFSYIQTEIEKRIFQLMVGRLKNNEQLIFTTHNADMLDLNLPKHSFALLRRNDEQQPEVVFVSSLLKRNTDSVRCAVENDSFCSLPDMSLLDELEA